MRRTTLYIDPELEVLLKLETLRQNRPMAEIVREAVTQYVLREPAAAPPGAGAFASGRTDTAERVDEALASEGFGTTVPAPPRRQSGRRRLVRRPKRR